MAFYLRPGLLGGGDLPPGVGGEGRGVWVVGKSIIMYCIVHTLSNL